MLSIIVLTLVVLLLNGSTVYNYPFINNFEVSDKTLCRSYNSMSCYYNPDISDDIWIFGGLQPDNEGNAVLDIQLFNYENEECIDYSTQTEWFTNFITGVEEINGKIYYNHYESDYIASYKFSEHATTREAYFLNNNLSDNYNLVITGNKIDTLYISGGNLNVFWMWNINTCSNCIISLNKPNYNHYAAPMEYYNGYVYIFGGKNTNKIERFNTQLYQIMNNQGGTWEVLSAKFNQKQEHRQSYVLGNTGLIYIFGINENIYYFNTNDNTLTQTNIALPNNPSRSCIVEYMNTLLIIGGENQNGKQILQSNDFNMEKDKVLDLEIKIKSKNYKDNKELTLKLETEGEYTADEVCDKVKDFFDNYH